MSVLAIIPILLLPAATPGSPALISVAIPEPTSPESCFANETLASMLSLVPGLRITRLEQKRGESLDAFRERNQAEWAVSGTRAPKEGLAPVPLEEVALEWSVRGKKASTRALTGPPGTVLRQLVSATWPAAERPRLYPGFAAPSARALELACASKAKEAYREAGAAVGHAVMRLGLATPRTPPKRGRGPAPILVSLAAARSLAESGQCTKALRPLAQLLSDFDRGQEAPVWRNRSDYASTAASEVYLVSGKVVSFTDGKFTALDLETGAIAWRLALGVAEPQLVEVGDGRLLAGTEDALFAIDLGTGDVLWSLSLEKPWPEVVRQGDRVFVAGERELVSVKLSDGSELWRHDPVKTISAGPVLSGPHLILPVETEAQLIEPASGRVVDAIYLGDEISSPLFRSEDEFVWAMVGGDKVVRLTPIPRADGAIQEVTRESARAPDERVTLWQERALFGALWPPIEAQGNLVVASARPGRVPELLVLSGDRPGKIARSIRGALAPVVSLPSASGVAARDRAGKELMALDAAGKSLWRTRPGGKISDLGLSGSTLSLSQDRRVIEVDPTNGKIVREIQLGDQVVASKLEAQGGVAVTQDGSIYGLPPRGDPRIEAYRALARLELAGCLIELRQNGEARKLLEPALAGGSASVDILALAARAEERTKPDRAAALWHELQRRAPPGDPLQVEAGKAMSRLIGLEARMTFESPIEKVVTSTDSSVVVLSKGRITGFGASNNKPWTLEGSALEATGTAAVLVDRRLHGASNGAKLGALEGGAWKSTGAGMLRYDPKSRRLTKAKIGARGGWSVQLDAPFESAHEAGDAMVVVTKSDAAHTVQALGSSDGRRLWASPSEGPISSAIISGGAVLLLLGETVQGLNMDTGSEIFKLRAPLQEIQGVTEAGDGWMLYGRDRVALLSSTGKLRASFGLAPGIDALVKPRGSTVAFAHLNDGTLVAIDLVRARTRGRIMLGNIRALAASEDRVLVLEGDRLGCLLFRAEPALEPSRP